MRIAVLLAASACGPAKAPAAEIASDERVAEPSLDPATVVAALRVAELHADGTALVSAEGPSLSFGVGFTPPTAECPFPYLTIEHAYDDRCFDTCSGGAGTLASGNVYPPEARLPVPWPPKLAVPPVLPPVARSPPSSEWDGDGSEMVIPDGMSVVVTPPFGSMSECSRSADLPAR